MRTTLSILDRTGDLTITWDHADEAAREKARKEVEALRVAGHSFFLVDGSPADEVNAGAGTLIVRRVEAAELVGPPTDADPAPVEAPVEAPADPPKRRGRPPKADRNVVAVRPLAGG